MNAFIYHKLTNDASREKYLLSYNIFKEHMKFICNIRDSMLPVENNIIISFDDGNVSDMEAADIMETYNIKGYFFIITSRIGKPGYLTRDNISDLHERGHSIGSHTHTHFRPFTSLSQDEIIREWNISLQILSDLLSMEVASVALPGGGLNRKVINAITKTDILTVFTSKPTSKRIQISKALYIGRYCITQNTTTRQIERLLLNKEHYNENLKYGIKKLIKFIVGYHRIQNLKKYGIIQN